MKLYKQVLLRRFLSHCTIITLLMFGTIPQVLAAGTDIKEYGIVIFPEAKCRKEAKKLNADIARTLSHLKNVGNYWHVPLYHGAYERKSLDEIYAKLKAQELKPFTLNFTKIYSTADRWVDLGAEKTEYLQNLHETVVQLASPYHKRPLSRSADIYKSMTDAQREQVDQYGVSGILAMYNPHMTLFYQYPPSSTLQYAAAKMENNFKKNMVCKAYKLIIGELGYNGNIKKIIYSINIPQEAVSNK